MNYSTWLFRVFIMFLVGIPIVWYGLGFYFPINWLQATMVSGIIIGCIAYYIEITSDRLTEAKRNE